MEEREIVILTLRRDLDDGTCTMGTLTLEGFTCQTIERPWIGGALGGVPGRSCVPAGTYSLEKHNSEAHAFTWALVNESLGVSHYPVAGIPRAACLIHPANFAYELRGCIAPGLTRFRNATGWQVVSSRSAFGQLKDLLPWEDGHSLEIVGVM